MNKKSFAKCLAAVWGVSTPLVLSHVGWAQTTIGGSSLALQSSGSASGTNWSLGSTGDGYVGTYIDLTQAAPVTFTLAASGTLSGGLAPDMTLNIADSSQSFSVTSTSPNNYTYTTPTLPAGTYFVRTQLDNQTATQTPDLTVDSMTVSGTGVSVLNSSTTTNAMNAATTYAQNFRAGTATLSLTLPNGTHLGAGTQVQVKLTNNAFEFAGAVYGQSPFSSPSAWLNYNTSGQSLTPTTSEQINYQNAVLSNFNAIVPDNAGKWVNNEFTQGSPTMYMLDAMADFAAQHGLGMRMHNEIWATEQPSYVTSLFSGTPGTLSTANKNTLMGYIANRNTYYYMQNNTALGVPRAQTFSEVDVVNEPFNTQGAQDDYYAPRALGVSGIASVYAQAAAAVKAAGANTTLYTNEYNVLQFSPQSISSSGVESGSDPYANWYLHGIQGIQQAGGPIGGIGMELYTNAGQNVNPANMLQAMQNLSVATGPNGNPIQLALTEFGVASASSGPTQANYDTDLLDSLTMAYGTPQATTFGFWGGVGGPNDLNQDTSNGAVYSLYNSSYQLSPAGQTWENFMNQVNTNLTLTTNANGQVTFDGTYGIYDVTVGGQQYSLDLEKGTTNYGLLTPIGTATWFGGGGTSNWSTSANWTPALAANAPVIFTGTVGLTPNNDSAAGTEYAGITFSTAASTFVLTGNSVNLAGDLINNSPNLQTVNLNLVLQQNTNLNAAGGDMAVGGNISGGFALTKLGSHTLTLSGMNSYSGSTTVNAGALIVGAAGALPSGTNVSISAGAAMQLASGVGAQTVSGLTVLGSLDVTNNAIVLNYGSPGADPISAIQTALTTGAAFNGSNATWTGSGITSSTAALSVTNPSMFAGKTYVVGYLDGNNMADAQYGTVAANQIVIAYTVAGDAFLEGSVGFHDLLDVAQHYQQTGQDYAAGNFFYNPAGSVGFADLLAIAQSYGQSFSIADISNGGGNTITLGLLQPTSPIPEPASVGLALAGGFGLLARRRRK